MQRNQNYDKIFIATIAKTPKVPKVIDITLETSNRE